MSHTIGQVKQQQPNSNSTEAIPDSKESSDKSSPSSPALTDGDYEFLFNQLLQGVAHGWQQKRVEKFFIQLGDRGNQSDWVDWLSRFSTQILTRHIASKEQLGMLMMRLGEISRSIPSIELIGATSYQIGRELLAQGQNRDVAIKNLPLKPPSTLTEISQKQAPANKERETLVWEYHGSDLVESSTSSAIDRAEISKENHPTSEQIIIKQETLDKADREEISPIEIPELESIATEATETEEPLVENAPAELPELESIATEAVEISKLQLVESNLEAVSSTELSELESTSNAEVQLELPQEREQTQLTSSELLSLIQQDEELAQQISQKLNISLTPEKKQDFGATLQAEPDKTAEPALELVESWFNLGLKQVSGGEFAEAIESWEEALQLNPHLAEAWHNRGSALGRLGQYQLAVESFEKSLAIAPRNDRAWNDRAHALYQLQKWTKAVASWNQALDITPGNHLFWYHRGCALEQLQSFDESIASYEKALEIKPDFQLARSRYINLVADNSQTN